MSKYGVNQNCKTKIDLDLILSRNSAIWMYKSTEALTILCNEGVGAHKIKNLV